MLMSFFLVPLDGLTTIRTPIVPALDVTSHRFGSAGTTQNRTALKTFHPRRADIPPIGQSLSLPRKCDDVSNPRIALVPFASPQLSRSINNTACFRSELRGTLSTFNPFDAYPSSWFPLNDPKLRHDQPQVSKVRATVLPFQMPNA